MWQTVCMFTVYPYLFALHSVRFLRDLQFQVIDTVLAFSSMTMAQQKKHVRTLHDRLKIIQEVEKNPGEKCVDIAKRLGLPASTLNSKS
jgi:predicted transcriptional regulator